MSTPENVGYEFQHSENNELLEWALAYANIGWHVLPVHSIKNRQCTCDDDGCKKYGKHPRIKKWQELASTNEKQIKKWWTKWPDANIGIQTGKKSGILVIDIDPRNGGEQSLKQLETENESLPDTLKSKTGGGGWHIFLKYPTTYNKFKKTLLPGLDIQADGRYVVAPPSIHASGDVYVWDKIEQFKDADLAYIPEWLLNEICKQNENNVTKQNKENGKISEGLRNDALFKLACEKAQSGEDLQSILNPIIIENKTRCIPPLQEGELRQIVQSACNYNKDSQKPLLKNIEKVKIFSANELLRKKFKPIKWTVPHIIPEGVTLLAGKPEMGKSWMGLNIAVSSAQGGIVFNKFLVEQGRVLYLALEDSERRLQSRLQTMNLYDTMIPNLDFAIQWNTIDNYGLKQLEDYIKDYSDMKLIIIDPLAMIRPSSNSRQNLYQKDYRAIRGFGEIANKYNLSIVIIHHLRKQSADDPYDEISGTTGLLGAADTLLILKKFIGKADAELSVTGRDVEENSYAMEFDGETGLWEIEGDVKEFKITDNEIAILKWIDSKDKVTTKEVENRFSSIKESTVRWCLRKLVDSGQLYNIGRGIYTTNQPTIILFNPLHQGVHQQIMKVRLMTILHYQPRANQVTVIMIIT